MKSELLEFLSREILSGQTDFELQSDDDLLASEIIDSMGVMRLIAFVEERYDVRVPPEDVTIGNFSTVDAICSYLSQRGVS